MNGLARPFIPKHRMKNGDVIAIHEMDDNHLSNTVRLLKRKAKEGIVVRYGGGTTAEDMWYDEDCLFGDEALDQLGYKHYAEELHKRGLQA